MIQGHAPAGGKANISKSLLGHLPVAGSRENLDTTVDEKRGVRQPRPSSAYANRRGHGGAEGREREDAGGRTRPRPQSASKTRPSEARKEQMTQTHEKEVGWECPVQNPDLPPVGEMDHLVDRCFCYLCVCGKHVCPGVYRKRTGIASMYATNYKVDYRRKSGEASKYALFRPMTPSNFSANRLPMDLQTVHMRDFQPYKIEPAQVPSELSTSASVAFISRSSYQTMYPNWGPADVVRVKRTGLPYRGDSLKLDPKTTYSENYTLSKSALAMKDAPKPPLSKTTSLLKSTCEFYGVTTSMTSFRPFTPDQMAIRAVRPVEKNAAVTSPMKHFRTTYGLDFTAKKPPIRPPKVPKNLVIL